jgi:glycosyltransferase involved in cell wall biosynthesis
MLPLLIFGKIIEKPPIKKCDKIICVSDKVKNQIEELYGKRDNLVVIRTGVDVKDFKIRKKNEIRKKLNLEQDKIYSLYVGKGGYWTKGLDRTIKLGEEIYKLNNNFRLICIGPDYKKVKSIIENKEFVIFMENVPREKMPLYYSASDIFFCLSRYEGGAPTLVVSEAMASGCLLVCSKDSEQEIISDGKNGLIVEKFNDEDAKSILEILKNKKKKEKIVQNEIITIKKLTLEKWGKEYIKELLK